MTLKVGQTLQNGKFLVEKEWARGHFDISYLAKKPDGERCLLKVLDTKLLSTLSDTERSRLATMFRQEAVKLAKLRGTPNIIQTEMPFEENDVVCLPIEYVQGNSLDIRPQPTLSEEVALEYIKQIGEALIVVHSQQLVHRDVRPSNIMLRIRNGYAEAVLTNFGLAIDCDTELTYTRRRELVDGFSPIELYSRGKALGPYTDIYSLAATLYELLTGEMPVSAEELKHAEDKDLDRKTLIAPQTKNPDISGKTVKAIRAGMELYPKKRPQSVAEWLSKLDLKHENTNNIKQKNVNWLKWQTFWQALAAVIVLLVGIPAWLTLRVSKESPTNQQSPVIEDLQK